MKLTDAEVFYKAVRQITGSLDQAQVATISSLLVAAANWPIGFLAYGLATAWHEARLKPIHEFGSDAYLSKYDTGSLALRLGNTPEADGDGIRYAGRGLVQLTGRANYKKAGDHVGVDLIAHPDLALDPAVATKVLVWGMESGAFTGRRLGNYLVDRGTYDAFVRCRAIINGHDCDAKIAGYADLFQDALSAGGWK